MSDARKRPTNESSSASCQRKKQHNEDPEMPKFDIEAKRDSTPELEGEGDNGRDGNNNGNNNDVAILEHHPLEIGDRAAKHLTPERLVEFWPFLEGQDVLTKVIFRAWQDCGENDPVVVVVFDKSKVHRALGAAGNPTCGQGLSQIASVDNLVANIMASSPVAPPPELTPALLRSAVCFNMTAVQTAKFFSHMGAGWGPYSAAILGYPGASLGLCMVSSGRGFVQLLTEFGYRG
jgi:hypothetical protein